MAIQTVLSSNTFNQFRVTTNQVIANVNSQYDGTANLVLNSANSASINVTTLTVYGDAAIQGGDITTNNLTFTLANTTATTLQLGGAANVLIGSTAGNTTIRSANTVLTGDLHVNGGDILSTATTLNIANTTATTLSVGGDATALLLGATTGTATIRNATVTLDGDLNVNGGDIATTATTFNVANTTATTMSVGGAATALLLGATTGTATIRNASTVIVGDLTVSGGDITGTASLNLANTVTTNLELGGAANVNIGSTAGNTSIRSANTVLTGDLFVNGGDIFTTNAIFTVANNTTTTLELGGAASVNIGSTAGNTTIRSANTVLTGDLHVNGGDILSTQTTLNIANTTATTLSVGGAATALLLGATTGTATVRNANVVLDGDLAVNGGDITTTSTTFNVANTTATTLSVGGGATALLIGATTGTATIRNASTVITGDLTVSGGDIVGTASLNLANTTTTALEIGGAATTLNMGSTTANTTIRGPNLNVGGTISTGFGVSTGVASIELGTHRTGDGTSFVDFHSTPGTDREARILRDSGANGDLQIEQTGAGNLKFLTAGTERARFDANGQFSTGNLSPKAQFHLYSSVAGQLTANLTDSGSRTDMLRLSSNSSLANAGGTLVFSSSQGDTANSVGFAAIKGMLTNGSSNTVGSISFSTRNVETDTALTERVRIEANGNLTAINDIAVNGGDITTTSSTFTVANATATTLSLGGGATSVLIGATTGNTTIRSANTILTGDLLVNGGDIFTTNTIFSIANNTATTVWLGGGATSNVIVGATTGNTTLRSADTTVDGKLTVKGITNIGVNTSTDALRITQEGSGNALVIQDVSSDTTSIVVDAEGKLIVGGTTYQGSWFSSSATPSAFITGNTTNGDGLGIMTYGSTPIILMGRHGPNTLNTRGTVSNGDELGNITFAGDANIGGGLSKGAVIQIVVDSTVDTPNTTSIPSSFYIRTKTANVSTPGTTATFDSSGNTTLSTNLAVNGNAITTTNTVFAIANSTATTVSVGGAATSLLIGATTGTTTIRNASTVIVGDLTVSGGDIVGTASLNLANVTSTTLNIGGAATTLNIGATTGNTTIRNAGTVIAGDLFVQGGDIVATTTTANLANSTTTTLNIGGAANVITVGAANSGTFTVNNNKAIINSTGALRVPVGNTIQRGTAAQGEVRYNTELTAYEGYDGTNWSSLGGVKSVDGLTYIIAESSPGNSDDTLHFYTANGATSYEVAQMNATKLAILQTTASTSATTGALTVAGGVGINEKLFVNGATTISANLTVSGNTAINGGGVTTTNTIFTVANTNATLLELGGAANVNIGSTTGNTTIRSANTIITGNTIIGGNLTVNGNTTIINSTTLSIDDKNIILADGAADNAAANGAGITIAGSNANVVYLSASDSFDINKSIITPGDIAVNGGDITTSSATFNVANTTATTMSVGGAATALLLGATTGTATIRNATTSLSGRTLIGTNTSYVANTSNAGGGGGITPGLQVTGNDQSTSSAGLYNWSSALTSSSTLAFSKSSSGTVGTRGAVANNVDLGNITFAGDDGTNFIPAAHILAEVDGTPGTADMPGRLIFATTADGANVATTRLTIDSTGLSTFAGNTAINGGGITTTANTFTLANTTATTVELGGAANVSIGSTTSNTVIRSANTVLSGDLYVNGGEIRSTNAIFNLANLTSSTIGIGGAATTILVGANTGTITLRNASTVIAGDLTVSGGDIISTTASLNLANTTATTVELGGATTTLNMGSTTGNTTVRNNLKVLDNGSTFTSGRLILVGNNTGGYINQNDNSNIYLSMQGAERVRIEYTSGNVVLGTGTGALVINGPSITTNATSFAIANTTATTLSVGGAATALLLGATTGTATIRNASTVVTGDLNVNGGDIGTTATTFTVANTTATTLWLGAGATSNVLIGATTGNTFIRSANTTVNGNFTANGTITETANGQQWAVASQYDIGMNPNQIPLNQYLGSMAFQSADAISVGAATVSADLSVNSGNVITTSTTFNIANTTATSVSLGGAANVLIGSTTGNTTIRSANTTVGELFVTGGDIYTTTSAFTLANTVATTLSVGGAATALLLGATTGTATIRNASTVLVGDLAVNGGDITTSATTFNVANTTATTLSVGGATTALLLGANTGTATIRNAATVLSGTLDSFGAASLCTGGSGDALYVGLSGSRVIINAGGAGNNIKAENANGTMSIYAGGTTSNGITVAANGSVSINSTIVSTSTTTGALRVAGGLGVVGNTYISGDIVLNGANVITTNTAFNIANTTATAVEIAGAATTLNMGATTGTANIRNATVNLLGSAITTPSTTFAIANTNAATLSVGGAATALLLGATTGTATIRNATVTLAGSALTGPAAFSVANTTSTTLGIGGAATSLLIGATTGTVTLRNANVVVNGTLSARYATKIANTATATSLTPNVSTNNQYSYTALAAGLTINAPTGTPLDGERLMFRIKDDGTSRAITWDAIYRIIGTVLPTNTVANKTMYIGCIYNTADTKWDVIAVTREA